MINPEVLVAMRTVGVFTTLTLDNLYFAVIKGVLFPLHLMRQDVIADNFIGSSCE